jgi:hypothetical protein
MSSPLTNTTAAGPALAHEAFVAHAHTMAERLRALAAQLDDVEARVAAVRSEGTAPTGGAPARVHAEAAAQLAATVRYRVGLALGVDALTLLAGAADREEAARG